MAENNNPSIDLSSIENSMKKIDGKLKTLNDFGLEFQNDRIAKNKDANDTAIGNLGLVGYGTLTLSLFALVKDDSQMKTAIEGLKESLGGLGSTLSTVFVPIVNTITNLVDAFNALPESAKLVLLVGTMIIGAVLGLVQAFVLGSAAFTAITTATGLLGTTLLPIVGIVILVIAGIMLLVAGLIYAYTHFEGFRNLVDTVWAAIKNGLAAVWAFFQPMINTIVSFFLSEWQRITTWWSGIWPVLQQAFMNIWNGIMAFLQPIIAGIMALFEMAWPYIQIIITTTMNAIKTIIQTIWNIIKTIFSGAVDVIMSIVEAFAYLFTGQWSKCWNSVLNIFKTIFSTVISVIRQKIDGVLKVINTMISGIGDLFSRLMSDAKRWGSNLIDMFISGIRSMIGGVRNAANAVMQPLKDFLGFASPTKKGPGSRSHKWAPNFMDMFTAGIYAGLPGIKQVANQSASQLAVMNGGHKSMATASTSQGFGSGANTINISELVVREEADIERIAQKLHKMQMGTERAGGAISYGY
ncbi:hypothetical protein IC619_012820 [Hazenella sp. IB182353]|uniref:phage tail protein n=1 Tax=Polycladospora coralii TaxID=2771432 RepID=UPI001746B52D|nr:hypothetical protein [Polycladospora coralii]MBS7531376.1 hypothetical protein [Polycladospora coralii]